MPEKEIQSNNERGQSLVEFAFGMVVLVILLAGVVDGGRALFSYMALRDAAQEGALYGSTVPSDTNGIKQRVLNSSDLVLDSVSTTDINVQIIGKACTGNGIRVTVTMPDFRITTPFLGAMIGTQSIAISASVTDTILSPYLCP
jgi:Flp pilus assembly protein TadG